MGSEHSSLTSQTLEKCPALFSQSQALQGRSSMPVPIRKINTRTKSASVNTESPSQSHNGKLIIPRLISKTKTLFVLVHDSIQIAIRFDSLEEECLTCGWLVSETIRKFEKMNVAGAKSNNSIIALQTVDSTITLDYWLSDTHRSISPLKDGTILKPFYSDSNFKIAKQKVNLNYFYILKLLGTGGTSKVFLARGKENGKFYAIKVISKKEALKRDKEEVFFNERNIMVRLNHPFLTKLYFSFQTVKYLPLTEIKNFQG